MQGSSRKLVPEVDTPSSGTEAKVKRCEKQELTLQELVGKLSGLPKGINDCLMTLKLPLSGNKYVIIVSAYVPTVTNPVEVKYMYTFYHDLDDVISATQHTCKLILLCEFNTRVGTDHYRPLDQGRSYKKGTREGVISP